MINEEVTQKLITIEMKMAKVSSKHMIKVLLALNQQAMSRGMKLSKYIESTVKSRGQPLKNLVGKGQLEEIEMKKGEFRELRRLMNRYGVKFSIMKDKKENTYSVFYQARDGRIMEKAFKKAIENYETKHERKESTLKKIKEFKEKSKELFGVQTKLKNRKQEKSL